MRHLVDTITGSADAGSGFRSLQEAIDTTTPGGKLVFHVFAALALWPTDDSERPHLELQAGEARLLGEGTGEDLLTSARDGLLARGDRERAAEAEACLGLLAFTQGRERSPHLDRALALVADAPQSHSKAVVLKHRMMHLLAAAQNADALQGARETLAMARALQARDIEAGALGVIGAARVSLGDPGGVADLERCVALYEEQGSSAVIEWQGNLAYAFAILGDLRRSSTVRGLPFRRPSASVRPEDCIG
jgi:hypothetical protein